MITKAGSLSAVVATLLVVGSVGGLAGHSSPAIADDRTDDQPAATSTSVPDSSDDDHDRSGADAGRLHIDDGHRSGHRSGHRPTTTDTVGQTIAPTATAAIDSGAGAGAVLAVPIAQPASATGATPARGTQVQLHSPPPPPSIPADQVLPANSGDGRRVVYSKTLQRVWAVDEFGTVVKTHRVSGKLTPLDPAPGVYSVWSRSRNTCAIHNPSICWGYMVRFATGARGGNIGFHEIPYQYGQPVQSVDQLGEALSGGCVRQATPDAIWMWDWAQLGTVVVVLA